MQVLGPGQVATRRRRAKRRAEMACDATAADLSQAGTSLAAERTSNRYRCATVSSELCITVCSAAILELQAQCSVPSRRILPPSHGSTVGHIAVQADAAEEQHSSASCTYSTCCNLLNDHRLEAPFLQ